MKKLIVLICAVLLLHAPLIFAGGESMGLPQRAVDAETNAPYVIDVEHAKIHEGVRFSVCDIDTDVDSTTKYWYIQTDTEEEYHFTFRIVADNVGTIYFYEDPTLGTGYSSGTVINAHNSKRISTTASGLIPHSDFSFGAGASSGTVLAIDLLAAGKKIGGRTDWNQQFIINPALDYLIMFTAVNNDTQVIFCADFHK